MQEHSPKLLSLHFFNRNRHHVRWEDKSKGTAHVKYADPKRDLAIIELTTPLERDYYPASCK